MTQRWQAAGVLALVLLTASACGSSAPVARGCEVQGISGSTVTFDLEQAQNAATIAAVGNRLGMPDHAVTVALATAMQESGLRNLRYGDRDSLGLFQQRPSQGWGSARQILVPRVAAKSFYLRLLRVPGWQQLPVTQAAQAVQLSGRPSAYAGREQDARALALALTGEVPVGLRCDVPKPSGPLRTAELRDRAARELGPESLHPRTKVADWRTAAWLVANAADLQLRTVGVQGHIWTALTGKWSSTPAADGALRFS